jgi:hypothetical protein
MFHDFSGSSDFKPLGGTPVGFHFRHASHTPLFLSRDSAVSTYMKMNS